MHSFVKNCTKGCEDANSVTIPGYKDVQDVRLIIRLEGDGNYTRLYVTNTIKPLLVSQTLKYFEGIFSNFIRLSKSALINSDYVREVVDEGSKQLRVVLTDGTTIDVSRRRINETKARLFHYQYDGNKRIWLVGNQAKPTVSNESRVTGVAGR